MFYPAVYVNIRIFSSMAIMVRISWARNLLIKKYLVKYQSTILFYRISFYRLWKVGGFFKYLYVAGKCQLSDFDVICPGSGSTLFFSDYVICGKGLFYEFVCIKVIDRGRSHYQLNII